MSQKFNRAQLAMTVESLLDAGVEIVTGRFPHDPAEVGEGNVRNGFDDTESASIAAIAIALSVFYNRTTGKNMGADEVLEAAGDYDTHLELMVSKVWLDGGRWYFEGVTEAQQRNPDWSLADVLGPYWIDTKKHAMFLVDNIFQDYLTDPVASLSNDGCELDDGGIIEWPDEDGTIRRRDKDGDCVEVRTMSTAGWQDWRNLFPDDALYFQPDGAGDEDAGSASRIRSFQVYRDYEKARSAHPDCEILTFVGEQIEEAQFLDVENPTRRFPVGS